MLSLSIRFDIFSNILIIQNRDRKHFRDIRLGNNNTKSNQFYLNLVFIMENSEDKFNPKDETE